MGLSPEDERKFRELSQDSRNRLKDLVPVDQGPPSSSKLPILRKGIHVSRSFRFRVPVDLDPNTLALPELSSLETGGHYSTDTRETEPLFQSKLDHLLQLKELWRAGFIKFSLMRRRGKTVIKWEATPEGEGVLGFASVQHDNLPIDET